MIKKKLLALGLTGILLSPIILTSVQSVVIAETQEATTDQNKIESLIKQYENKAVFKETDPYFLGEFKKDDARLLTIAEDIKAFYTAQYETIKNQLDNFDIKTNEQITLRKELENKLSELESLSKEITANGGKVTVSTNNTATNPEAALTSLNSEITVLKELKSRVEKGNADHATLEKEMSDLLALKQDFDAKLAEVNATDDLSGSYLIDSNLDLVRDSSIASYKAALLKDIETLKDIQTNRIFSHARVASKEGLSNSLGFFRDNTLKTVEGFSFDDVEQQSIQDSDLFADKLSEVSDEEVISAYPEIFEKIDNALTKTVFGEPLPEDLINSIKEDRQNIIDNGKRAILYNREIKKQIDEHNAKRQAVINSNKAIEERNKQKTDTYNKELETFKANFGPYFNKWFSRQVDKALYDTAFNNLDTELVELKHSNDRYLPKTDFRYSLDMLLTNDMIKSDPTYWEGKTVTTPQRGSTLGYLLPRTNEGKVDGTDLYAVVVKSNETVEAIYKIKHPERLDIKLKKNNQQVAPSYVKYIYSHKPGGLFRDSRSILMFSAGTGESLSRNLTQITTPYLEGSPKILDLLTFDNYGESTKSGILAKVDQLINPNFDTQGDSNIKEMMFLDDQKNALPIVYKDGDITFDVNDIDTFTNAKVHTRVHLKDGTVLNTAKDPNVQLPDLSRGSNFTFHIKDKAGIKLNPTTKVQSLNYEMSNAKSGLTLLSWSLRKDYATTLEESNYFKTPNLTGYLPDGNRVIPPKAPQLEKVQDLPTTKATFELDRSKDPKVDTPQVNYKLHDYSSMPTLKPKDVLEGSYTTYDLDSLFKELDKPEITWRKADYTIVDEQETKGSVTIKYVDESGSEIKTSHDLVKDVVVATKTVKTSYLENKELSNETISSDAVYNLSGYREETIDGDETFNYVLVDTSVENSNGLIDENFNNNGENKLLEGDTVVKYTYRKVDINIPEIPEIPVKEEPVVVSFVDENNTKLKEDVVLVDNNKEPEDIQGYTFVKKDESNPKNIKYVYQKKPVKKELPKTGDRYNPYKSIFLVMMVGFLSFFKRSTKKK